MAYMQCLLEEYVDIYIYICTNAYFPCIFSCTVSVNKRMHTWIQHNKRRIKINTYTWKRYPPLNVRIHDKLQNILQRHDTDQCCTTIKVSDTKHLKNHHLSHPPHLKAKSQPTLNPFPATVWTFQFLKSVFIQ